MIRSTNTLDQGFIAAAERPWCEQEALVFEN